MGEDDFHKKRYPEELHNSMCSKCSLGGDLLLCDGCNQSFHIDCLGFDECPEEDTWFCDDCVEERAPRNINPSIQTFDDFIHLISQAQNILVISGAGISVTAGIPDFRSEMGLYRMLRHIDLGLTQEDFDGGFCSEDLFGMDFFRKNPRPFYRFFQTMVTKTNSVDPTPMHYFLKELQNRGKLLRIFTQNIDMLEQKVGIDEDKVVACHGSAEKFTCLCCKATISGAAIIEKMVLDANLSQQSTQEAQKEQSQGKNGFYIPKCSEFISPVLPPHSPTGSGMGLLTSTLQQSHISSPPPSFGPSPCSTCIHRFQKKFRNTSLVNATLSPFGHFSHFGDFGDCGDVSDDSDGEYGSTKQQDTRDTNASCQGVLKPDIIFFGEQLPEKVFTKIAEDTRVCDLVLVMGTSMKVSPVAAFPSLIPKRVPLLNINRDWVELRPHIGHFDAQFQGSSDTFALKAAESLGWELPQGPKNEPFSPAQSLLSQEEQPKSPIQSQVLSREDVGLNAVKDFYSGVVPNWVLNSMGNSEMPNTLHSNLTLDSSTTTQETILHEVTITHDQRRDKLGNMNVGNQEKDNKHNGHDSETEFGLFLQFLHEYRDIAAENLGQYDPSDIESFLNEFCSPGQPSIALRHHIDLYRENISEFSKQKQDETTASRKKTLQDGNQENINSNSTEVALGSVNMDMRTRTTEKNEEEQEKLGDQNERDQYPTLVDIKRVRTE